MRQKGACGHRSARQDEGLNYSNTVGWVWTILTKEKKELDLVTCDDTVEMCKAS